MEGRHANAKYCPLCKQEVKRERRRERQRRRRRDPEWQKKEHAKRRAKRARARAEREATVDEAMKRERRCGDCGTDISDRGGRSTRCVACQAERRRQLERERYRQAEGIAEERRCKECGESIADRHARAKYCESCAELRKTAEGRRYMRQRRQDPAFRRRMSENWPCRRHLVVLLVEQNGLCGICGEPMPADEIDCWVVGRIVPASAGGLREKENCQVVHLKCSSRKGARWEGSVEAQVARWAPWKLGA